MDKNTLSIIVHQLDIIKIAFVEDQQKYVFIGVTKCANKKLL